VSPEPSTIELKVLRHVSHILFVDPYYFFIEFFVDLCINISGSSSQAYIKSSIKKNERKLN
jgi:hypothetical protein